MVQFQSLIAKMYHGILIHSVYQSRCKGRQMGYLCAFSAHLGHQPHPIITIHSLTHTGSLGTVQKHWQSGGAGSGAAETHARAVRRVRRHQLFTRFMNVSSLTHATTKRFLTCLCIRQAVPAHVRRAAQQLANPQSHHLQFATHGHSRHPPVQAVQCTLPAHAQGSMCQHLQ
jgi:hypothetical protein